MARIPVAELRVQTQGPGLVRADATAPARSGGDLRDWATKAPVSSGAMVMLGLGMATIGGLGALLMTVGFAGTIALGSLITAGGGLAFLGVLKRKGRPEPEPLRALPPASSPAVVAERARRVQSVLEQGGDFTFERLLSQLRWTEGALLETLVAMKEAGQVIEDLDLETGEWVYRGQYAELGAGSPMTLEDRQARQLRSEAR